MARPNHLHDHDRFNNPDRGPAHPVFDDEGKFNPVNAFQGGTIKGNTEKLGYLEELGVTALWIAPPLQNVQKLNPHWQGKLLNRQFRFAHPSDPTRFDAQVTMGLGCLLCSQGIPKIYYGTEQGLHGFGNSDRFVREALCGIPNAFDTSSPFFKAIQAVSAVHASQPALHYGRQFFRGISGGGTTFGISMSAHGIVSFSRILNDTEVVVLANTFTDSDFSGFVIVDFALNPDGTELELLYSKQGQNAIPPGKVQTKDKGTVTIHYLRGGTSDGPLRILPFSLQPTEVQILGRSSS